jgi:hypothetical protein
MLSKTRDIMMVDRMVMTAPLTVSKMYKVSPRGTIPAIMSRPAPIPAGTASLIPRGLQMINMIVKQKTAIVKNI